MSPQSAGLRQARGTAVILRHRQVVGAHRLLDGCMPQVTAAAPPMAVVCPIRPRQWLRGKAFGTVGHAGAGEQAGGGCHSQTLTALTTQSGSLPGPPPASRCRTWPVRTLPAAQQRPDPHPPSHPGAVAAASRAAAPPRRGWQRVDSDRAQAVSCPERTPTTAAHRHTCLTATGGQRDGRRNQTGALWGRAQRVREMGHQRASRCRPDRGRARSVLACRRGRSC